MKFCALIKILFILIYYLFAKTVKSMNGDFTQYLVG